LAQKASRPMPFGLIAPMPVTTTRLADATERFIPMNVLV
jgi:hypothetical protein